MIHQSTTGGKCKKPVLATLHIFHWSRQVTVTIETVAYAVIPKQMFGTGSI